MLFRSAKHRRADDRGELDLLPYREPAWRVQLAHAVGYARLIGALRRISGRDRAGTILTISSARDLTRRVPALTVALDLSL